MSTLPALSVPGHDLVVVDVEGNGQQPPEVIEIAVLPLTRGQDTTPADLRTWLVHPTRPITGLVTGKVHGISNDDVATAPRWPEVADDITAALGRRAVVAHNASVERRVLAAHLPDWQPPLWLDTLRLAKAVWPGLAGGYGLDNLIRHSALPPPELTAWRFDNQAVTPPGRHRAGYDTWMTATILITLIRDGRLDADQLLSAARLPDPTKPRAGNASDDAAPEHGGLW